MAAQPQRRTPRPAMSAAERAALRALRGHEPIFHGPAWRKEPAALARLVHPGFFEIGASGRRYSRAFVLRVVGARGAQPGEARWRTRGFHCRQLAADLFLITYTLQQLARVTRRSTLWQRGPSGWRILFHQGTLVAQQELRHEHESARSHPRHLGRSRRVAGAARRG